MHYGTRGAHPRADPQIEWTGTKAPQEVYVPGRLLG
jgi:hypothetical protein